MTLKEVETLLKKKPAEIFGDVPGMTLRHILSICHPDRFIDPNEKAFADTLFRRTNELYETLTGAVKRESVIIRSKKRAYILGEQIGLGDASAVFKAEGEKEPGVTGQYVVKVSRVPGADALLQKEYDALLKIHKQAGDEHYAKYFPLPVETIKAKSNFVKRVNIFAYDDGFYTLKQIREKHTALSGRHFVWMFKRLLTGIGFSHLCGIVHGAILPPNILYHPADHGCRIIGWIHNVGPKTKASTISSEYKLWYPPEVLGKRELTPATDIYMAAKCMLYAVGFDPVKTHHIPESKLPVRLALLLRACLIESPSKRPQNAWELLDEVKDAAESVYGPPKFVELSMT